MPELSLTLHPVAGTNNAQFHQEDTFLTPGLPLSPGPELGFTRPSLAGPAGYRDGPSTLSITACRPGFAALDLSASRAYGPGANVRMLLTVGIFGEGAGGQKFRS